MAICRKLSVLVAFFAVAAGIFVSSNRMLLGLSTGLVSDEHASFIKTKDDVLNYYLEKHHKQIGPDFVPYQNHCLRVLVFTRYFLHTEKLEHILDDPRTFNIVAMALAYHDIALWTDGELNYLEPSVTQMTRRVLDEMRLSQQAEGDEGTMYVPIQWHWSNFEEDSDIAKTIILHHHKFTDYNSDDDSSGDNNNNKSDEKQKNDSGKKQQQQQEPKLEHMDEIVNAVRKADWADATMGIIRFGLPQSLLGATYEAIPDEGFHNVLVELTSRLSPDSTLMRGQLEVMKILKW